MEKNKQGMDPELAAIVDLLLDDNWGIKEEVFQSLCDYAATYGLRHTLETLHGADATDGRFYHGKRSCDTDTCSS